MSDTDLSKPFLSACLLALRCKKSASRHDVALSKAVRMRFLGRRSGVKSEPHLPGNVQTVPEHCALVTQPEPCDRRESVLEVRGDPVLAG